MGKFKLTINGNKALIKGLEKISKGTRMMVGDEIEASTYTIQSDAIQQAPVNDGFLKNSISAQNKELVGQVETGVHYAPYVEFGTGGMVNVPAGLEDYAIQFKGKGIKQVNLPPRPFFFPAFYRETPKLIERINKGLEKLTN